MNAEISETIGARLLGFGVQIPELLTQRKFVSTECHAHSNAHKPPKTVATIKILADMYWSRQYLSIDKKICHAHSNAHS